MRAGVRVTRAIDVSPERIWAALSTYAEWTRWGVSITAVQVEGRAVCPGARGRVRTRLGVWLPFEITEVVPGCSWRWRVAGVPATGHEVTPEGVGSRVTFTAPWWAAPYAPVLRAALARLVSLEA